MKLSKFKRLGLVGLMGLASGCSAVLEGASAYSKTRDQYIALKTGAEAARVYEADERAKDTGERGASDIANAIREPSRNQNGPYYEQDKLPDNPLLWALERPDTDGEYIVFEKNIELPGPNRGADGYEIFIMRNDGSGLRRLTFNEQWDLCPKISGNIVGWYVPSTWFNTIYTLNLVTGEKTEKKTEAICDISKMAVLVDEEISRLVQNEK